MSREIIENDLDGVRQTMKTTNKQTNREDLEALIRITTDGIQSTAIDAKLAFEKYDQIPSIPNGARRHETA